MYILSGLSGVAYHNMAWLRCTPAHKFLANVKDNLRQFAVISSLDISSFATRGRVTSLKVTMVVRSACMSLANTASLQEKANKDRKHVILEKV